MSGIMSGVKPIKMANGGLVPSGGLPYGSPQGALGGYGGMGLGTGTGYAEGGDVDYGDVDYKELAKNIGYGALDFVNPLDPINALLYALWLFPPAGAAATYGKLAYGAGKGIKAIRTAKKAKGLKQKLKLDKLQTPVSGQVGPITYDLGHKATGAGLGAYLGKELVEAAPDLYEIGETAVTDPEIIMEIIKESVPRKAEGGLLEAPVLYAAKGKVVKPIKKLAEETRKKKKKADADKKKKADQKAKKDRDKAEKDRDKAEKKRAEEQKKADEKIRKEEEIALANRSRWQKYQDWRKGKPWYNPIRALTHPLTPLGAAGAYGTYAVQKSGERREAEEKRKELLEQIEAIQTDTSAADAQAEREAATAEKRRRNRALIAAGREMTKYTEGYVPYNWLSDAATAYSDTMAGKDEPELIQTAYAMMAENPELEFEDALRSVLSRGQFAAVDPVLEEIQMLKQIPSMVDHAQFLEQQYYLSKLSPEALATVKESATLIE